LFITRGPFQKSFVHKAIQLQSGNQVGLLTNQVLYNYNSKLAIVISNFFLKMTRQSSARISKSSHDSQNRAAFTRLEGILSETSCDRCLLLKKPCFIDPFSKSKKCAECRDGKRGGCNAMSGMFL